MSAPLDAGLPGAFTAGSQGGVDTGLGACLWPLDRRDDLTAALASAAGLAQLGPADRFEVFERVHAEIGSHVRRTDESHISEQQCVTVRAAMDYGARRQ